MRVLSFHIGLLAAASLVLASACKPQPSSASGASSVSKTTSSSIQPSSASLSAPSSAVSSLVLPSVTSSRSSRAAASSSSNSVLHSSASASASPVPLASFYIVAGNTANPADPAIDGAQLSVGGDDTGLALNVASYVAQDFYFEVGRGYLMTDPDFYVAWDPITNRLLSANREFLVDDGGNYYALVCRSPVLEGGALSCPPAGNPLVTGVYGNGQSHDNQVFMFDPSKASSAFQTLDLVPQPG